MLVVRFTSRGGMGWPSRESGHSHHLPRKDSSRRRRLDCKNSVALGERSVSESHLKDSGWVAGRD